MRNRKFFTLSVIMVLVVFAAAGCGSNDTSSSGASDLVEGKVNVVASFYPIYDFSQKIGGDHVHVINLVPAGVEPHDWEPKSRDMTNIVKADMFVYNGAGFEGWVDDFLSSMDGDSDVLAVEATEGIELLKADSDGHEEEEHEDEAGHENEEHEDALDHDHGEYDPHVWLSPVYAKQMAENIKNALVQVDAENKADYESNYNQLIEHLDGLHHEFEEVVEAAPRNDIVVSHHAYAYLAHTYELRQVAVMGLSPEAEPTAREIKDISDFVKENDVKYILFEELVSPKLAEMLVSDLNTETMVFNPLEGLTDEQLEAGEDYFSIMRKNLETLKMALQ